MSKVICKHCGFDQNDIILSYCLICKKPLPITDISKITDEEIVLNTGEWIGKVGDSSFRTTQDFNMWKTAFLKNKYLGLNIGGVDKGVIEMSKVEIEEIAQKYLTILESRANVNEALRPVFISLKTELETKKKNVFNKAGGQKKIMLILLIIFIFLIILGPIIMILKIIF